MTESLRDRYGATTSSSHPDFPIAPITVEELLDHSNTQPGDLADAVRDCRTWVLNRLGSDDVELHELSFRDQVGRVDGVVRVWIAEHFPTMSPGDNRWVRARVIDDITGAGPIEPLRRDTRTTEIIVYSPQPVAVTGPDGNTQFQQGTSVEFAGEVAGKTGLRTAPGVIFDDDERVLHVVQMLAGKRPNQISPRLSATLPDGSRLQAVLDDLTGGHHTLAIRRHPEHAHTLVDLVDWGALPMQLAQDLAWFVRNRFTMVVAGATSSGKTTLLNALLPFVNPDHHVFIVEDTKEIIHPPFLQVSRRVARLAKGDAEAVSIRDHVKDALRFRPDIICIGELRDAAALEAMKAYNTGHEGSVTTCHANDAGNTLKRLAAMMTESPDMPSFDLAKDLVASAVDIVVFAKKFPDGKRRVTEVVEVEKPPRNSTGLLTEPEIRVLWQYTPEEGFRRLAGPSPGLFGVRGLPVSDVNPVGEEHIRAVCHSMRTATGQL